MSLLSFLMRMAAGVALCALPVVAQSIGVQASIPFDFEVANVLMPAGDYQVVRDAKDKAIVVRSLDRRYVVQVMPGFNNSEATGNGPEFRLVFMRYWNGKQTKSFLRSAWCGLHGTELLPTRSEREVQDAVHVAKGTRTEVVILARNLR
jgi:hypothetical protein